ncbi:DNA polymerase Y family protein [Sandaracinobacter neustonicus]|uniref:DNA-directed DNA polymerase n=1 Tax=Sandaracinobacter neustonicus TaxID=1715348 RepID=A0A501XHK7_9SPHN|nr:MULTISPECIES: DNA polymerase Y family protein [Alphaproteobacteria]TPE59794.1 DNA polymerase Y family protein [Sandaracinobacter neustonicus]HBI20141.1 nucleotidyltransferase [Brevundimonas sp.]
MSRVVSLYLPTWPTDRVRRADGDAAPPPDAPLVLVGHDGRRRAVLAADHAACAAGIRVGMTATQAQVLVPGLVLNDAQPEGDRDALERLAVWMLRRYAPIVAADPPDGLVMDTTGADHLHGGDAAMLAGMVERLAEAGVSARAAIADSWGAAHALARHVACPIHVSSPGESAREAAALPLVALRLPAALTTTLGTLGFERIGDLLAKPRAPLILRFGPELDRRLDQATGRMSEPINPVRPPEMIEVRRAFAEPIAAPETIARYIGKLVVRLCEALETKGTGARRLDLICARVDNHVQAVRVGLARPSRDVRRLTRLLCDKIETIEPGFGIDMLTLAAPIVAPMGPGQTVSLIDPATPDLSGLVDLLANRVGAHGLYRATPLQSDVPERAVGRLAPLAPACGTDWTGRWPRPSRLLTSPEMIQTVALLPDHPPVAFTWRGVRRRVARADGPERVFGEWWRRDAELEAVRDYFVVEDDAGERFWIYRAGDGEDPATGSHRWFLHGLFA